MGGVSQEAGTLSLDRSWGMLIHASGLYGIYIRSGLEKDM